MPKNVLSILLKIVTSVTLVILSWYPPQVHAAGIFTKYIINPIIIPSGVIWDIFSLQDPIVIKNSSGYKMWYEGNAGQGWRIGYAFSPNGISDWVRTENPVIAISSPDGTELYNESPYVLYNNDLQLYQMWYTSVPQNWQSGPDRLKLRYATSPDGKNWTKYDDYVLRGSPGMWDSGGIARGISVLYKSGKYHM
jgi:predicted GH43/DUF377 family glycosyl hydrolase